MMRMMRNGGEPEQEPPPPAAAPVEANAELGGQALAKLSCMACRKIRKYCPKVHPCPRCVELGIECKPQTRGRGRPPKRFPKKLDIKRSDWESMSGEAAWALLPPTQAHAGYGGGGGYGGGYGWKEEEMEGRGDDIPPRHPVFQSELSSSSTTSSSSWAPPTVDGAGWTSALDALASIAAQAEPASSRPPPSSPSRGFSQAAERPRSVKRDDYAGGSHISRYDGYQMQQGDQYQQHMAPRPMVGHARSWDAYGDDQSMGFRQQQRNHSISTANTKRRLT